MGNMQFVDRTEMAVSTSIFNHPLQKYNPLHILVSSNLLVRYVFARLRHLATYSSNQAELACFEASAYRSPRLFSPLSRILCAHKRLQKRGDVPSPVDPKRRANMLI